MRQKQGTRKLFTSVLDCAPRQGRISRLQRTWKMSQVSILIALRRSLTILVSPEVLKIIISHCFPDSSLSFSALVMKTFVPSFTSGGIILHALNIIIHNLEPFSSLQRSNLDCHQSLNQSRTSLLSFIYLLHPILKMSAVSHNLILLIFFITITKQQQLFRAR